MKKSSRVAGEALYFLSLDWRNSHFKYEQDHLHPFERFDGNKPIAVSMEDWRNWRGNRNSWQTYILEGKAMLAKVI